LCFRFYSRERINLRRLEEVDLQEGLEVEVGDRVLVRHAEEAGENAVGDDVALVRRVKARVRLDVVGDELRDLRLRALGASGQAHERAQLRREAAGLQEGVLGAAELPGGLLLGRHVGDILLDALAATSLLDLLGRGLGSEERVGDDLLQVVGEARADLAQALHNASDRGRGSLRSRGLRGRRGGRGDRRDNNLGLGRRLAGSLGGLRLRNRGGRRGRGGDHYLSGGLLGDGLLRGLRGGLGAHVYNRGRRLCGHF
jgi:hypothetical protein